MSDAIARETVENLREFAREQGALAAEGAEAAKAANDPRAWSGHHRTEIGCKTAAVYLSVLLGDQSDVRAEALGYATEALAPADRAGGLAESAPA